MLFPQHHWMDYPDKLTEEIQRILLLQLTPALALLQVAQPALVIAQVALQLPAALPQPVSQPPPTSTLLPLTGPMDVQTPQAPCTSAPALDGHGQPIPRPGHYEHSAKHKQNQQEEVDYRKSHKMRTTDELRTRGTPPPSTSCTECGKTPSKPTTRCHKQRTQQKAQETASQTSSQTVATSQGKVTTTKTAVPAKQMLPARQLDCHCSGHESHHHDDRH
uniref:Uncharacterized protein n=1 Tax=Romanomermis culicivorax TaxID=13658 RepID=A0A915KY85_ROMCU